MRIVIVSVHWSPIRLLSLRQAQLHRKRFDQGRLGEHQKLGEETDFGPVNLPTDFGFSLTSGPHLPDFLTLSICTPTGQWH